MSHYVELGVVQVGLLSELDLRELNISTVKCDFCSIVQLCTSCMPFGSGRGGGVAGRQVSVDSCLWDYRLACQHVVSTRDCVGFAGVHETVNVLMLAHCTRVFMEDMPKANTFQLYIYVQYIFIGIYSVLAVCIFIILFRLSGINSFAVKLQSLSVNFNVAIFLKA